MATEQEINIKFVKEVEKYPCLYNYQLPGYTRKNITEKAWIEVGEKLNLTRFQCKEKWKNIRTVFVRNLKESARKKRKPYYLNSFMQYALPYIKTGPTNSYKQMTENIDDNNEDDPESEDTDSQTTPRLIITQNTETETSNASQVRPELPQSTPASLPFPKRSPSPLSIDHSESSTFELPVRSSKRRREASGVNEGLLEYFTKQARMEVNCELEKNPKKMFLLSMMPDLETMSENQMRVFKRRVTVMVDEILGDSPTPS